MPTRRRGESPRRSSQDIRVIRIAHNITVTTGTHNITAEAPRCWKGFFAAAEPQSFPSRGKLSLRVSLSPPLPLDTHIHTQRHSFHVRVSPFSESGPRNFRVTWSSGALSHGGASAVRVGVPCPFQVQVSLTGGCSAAWWLVTVPRRLVTVPPRPVERERT
jgi:hypothetical protein